jgi:peroxiredoxin/predicted 2-oxoglutarate/Fe(II)-dependent dioxygenase YbiX
MQPPQQNPPRPGEPAPWFEARSPINPRFHFDTVAGRLIVLSFFGSAGEARTNAVLQGFLKLGNLFDDLLASFFGVSVDPKDESENRIHERIPGIHLFWDFDRKVSRRFGAASEEGSEVMPRTFVLDERLRVVSVIPFTDPPEKHVEAVRMVLAQLPPPTLPALANHQAPVLVIPRIFEPDLCKALIDYYEKNGGKESGFMREVGGKTVAVHDYGHKRRRDQEIADKSLRDACMHRIHDRLVPEIRKAFQFDATRIERYIVACYDATSGGHFRAHRDNTTKGTAHRRFAVSLNLNTGEFDGGLLRFPEFGNHLYAPPAGGAVVFSCSLLHEATPVTKGLRYAFLPFLYDEAAAKVRIENLKFLDQAPEVS